MHYDNYNLHCVDFYPRSPCGERLFEYIQAGTGILFLSTLSLRRATTSIIDTRLDVIDFYPRSPCGERPVQIVVVIVCALISIHALLAESDRVPLAESTAESISIHALLAESDLDRV